MVKIRSHFIANFKTGDNINYNLNSLRVLIAARRKADQEDKDAFIKPITVLIASITEAVLYDFIYRIRRFNREGVPQLTSKQLKALRLRKKDEFKVLIEQIKEFELFAKKDSDIYTALEELVDLRNRIHIQNKWGLPHPNESDTFTVTNMINAARTLERIMKGMTKYYPRKGTNYVEDFVLPWKAKA